MLRSFLLLVLGSLFLIPRPGAAADREFRTIFNGHDLQGWDGDPRYWSVRAGVLRGETTLAALPLHNTFLIYRGGRLRDFELRLQFRLRNGNSGVQYRSHEVRPWVVGGYQAEIDNTPGKAGFLYEEKGRKYLANLGEKVEVGAAGKPQVTAQFASKQDLLARGYYRARDWNDYRIIARGPHLEHWLNGVKTIELDDSDPRGRALAGLLALQIHVGPPMLVEFRDILLKNP